MESMEKEDVATDPRHRIRIKLRVVIASVVLLILSVAVVAIVQFRQEQSPALPEKTVTALHKATFTPYYFEATIPHDFEINTESVRYEADILLFKIENKNAKQNITITEQQLPTVLEQQPHPNAKVINGADGKAFIQYSGTHIMAGLFGNKHARKKTLVILTTDDPVQEETVADLLRGLRPL